MPESLSLHMYPCGDHALTIEWEDTADLANHRKVLALCRVLAAKKIAGIRDIIPAYSTVTVVYDTVALLKNPSPITVYERMCENILSVVSGGEMMEAPTSRQVSIPVCYDLSLAPDLLSLAESHGLTTDEVIHLHTARTYRVYMIGFLPGFAYMGTVDEKLVTPRKQSPRTLVPAGSVGIAGIQTGIYPYDSPGGWQLIGRTPMQMFDTGREQPSLLQPGEEVRFQSITLTEYHQMCKS